MANARTPSEGVDPPTVFQVFDHATVTDGPSDAAAPGDSAPEPVDPTTPSNAPSARYLVRAVLGRGGMGEVRLCRDERIGREVAVKVAHGKGADKDEVRRRFVREARIQAQLEHPSIVPVHEIDALEDGAPWFSMKRVRGQTLADILDARRRGDAAVLARHTIRRLLTALGSVCLAVDFAHSRGVIHRDLKPGNIMLGDFGEVYVLDWGLARVFAREDEPPSMTFADDTDEITDGGVRTEAGRVLGTPGYMAPEQLDASLGAQGRGVDVFALGALLFETVTGMRLIEARDRTDLLLKSMQGVEVRPSVRAPHAQVAPALEDIIVRCLARDPAQRFASARAIYEALDAFLSGEEALERRREMARMHAAAAETSIARWQAGDESARPGALQQIGQAVAIDPDNREARAALVKLLTTPPRHLPIEVQQRLEDERNRVVRVAFRSNALFFFAWLLFVPYAVWLGVRDWTPVGAVFVPLLVMSMISSSIYLQRKPSLVLQHLVVLVTAAAYVALSRAFGAFILVPPLLTVLAMSAQLHPDPRFARNTAAIAVASLVVIMALEELGVLARMYVPTAEGLLIRSGMLELSHPQVGWFLLVATILGLALPTGMVALIRRRLLDAEERVQVQAWWLEQLVTQDTPKAR